MISLIAYANPTDAVRHFYQTQEYVPITLESSVTYAPVRWQNLAMTEITRVSRTSPVSFLKANPNTAMCSFVTVLNIVWMIR